MPTKKSKTARQNAADKLPEPDCLRVRDAAALNSVNASTLREYLPEIPGVVRLSQRGIRIPRDGLNAWLSKMEISRK